MPSDPQECRDDQYAACQRLQRTIDTDRGLASTRAAVRSPTGCLGTARKNLRGDTALDYHGPCSPAEQALIKDEVHSEAPDPTIRSASKQAKNFATTARHAKKAAGLAGITAGTLLGEPNLTQKSARLLF